MHQEVFLHSKKNDWDRVALSRCRCFGFGSGRTPPATVTLGIARLHIPVGRVDLRNGALIWALWGLRPYLVKPAPQLFSQPDYIDPSPQSLILKFDS